MFNYLKNIFISAKNRRIALIQFLTKHKRFVCFFIITCGAYRITSFSLFSTNAFILPIISFIVLLLGIYFLAIDLQHFKQKYFWVILLIFCISQLFFFAGGTRHTYIEIVLFHGMIALLLYSLLDYLTNAISFSAFSYFTQGGYPIAAIITLFLSVLLLGKYSQIPFSCEDIDHFPQSLIASPKESVEEWVSTIQQGRNTIIGFFKPESEEVMLPPELLPPQTTIPKSEIELFFERSQNYFRTQIVDLQGSVTKNSCEFVMEKLKNLQMNDGFQLAVVLLLFFLFIGVAKILLRIISAIGFVIFLCLKPFKLYSLKKVHVERETLS